MDDAELRALLAAQAAQIAALVAAMQPTPSQVVPLAELYASYEATQKARPAWYSVRAMLHPFVKHYLDRDAVSLAVTDWSAYRATRSGLASSSRNTTLAYIKSMLRWAVKEGLLKADPPLCKASFEKQKDHRETAPDESEVQRVLAVCELQRERVMVLCSGDSGMRRNEIRQLQWSWVKWDRMEIALPNWACKGERGRVVPATRRELDAIAGMPRDIRSSYVIAKPKTGKPYVPQMFTNWWRALASAAGLEAMPGEKRVRLHDNRHGYATNAVERGVRIEVVSEILGHASLEQTRAYVQRRPRDLAKAREDFEAGIERDRK